MNVLGTISGETNIVPLPRIPLPERNWQASLPIEIPQLDPIFDALPVALAVLDDRRQLAYANTRFAALMDEAVDGNFLGMQPGEALKCVHALDTSARCGTSGHCHSCGVLRAVLAAQKGRESICESRITVMRDDKPVAMDLRIWAKPFRLGNDRYTLLSALDISNEKRRQVLERIFFHDIANTATVISGFADLLGSEDTTDSDDIRRFAGHVVQASDKLLDEIEAQRQLLAAETGDLIIQPQQVPTASLVTTLVELYRSQPLACQRHLQLDPGTENQIIWTDPALLSRVLGNMVKNALEASEPGDVIKVGCCLGHEQVCFWVHNPQHIPLLSQQQIFKRSFSTKGENRGLGTYSMKLLSEGYLQGSVSFRSSSAAGTTFLATYPFEWVEPPSPPARRN
jgi:signal transduction histidine kinase